MVDVVGVHGIAQQQAGRHQLLPLWQRGLADGIERAVGRNGPKPMLDLAYYGDFFLTDEETKGPAFDDGFELDADEVEFFAEIEHEVVDEDAEISEAAAKGFKQVPRPVGRLAAWLDRKFGVAGRVLFFSDLKQVSRYQRDDGLAERVFRRIREATAETPTLLIGHSLGSVVAYEYLSLSAGHGIEALVTLGSPLALASIQHGLRTRVPSGDLQQPTVESWVNVYDPEDPVTLGGGLSKTWPIVVDETVDNERDPHSVTRYLGKVQTGRAVVEALRADG